MLKNLLRQKTDGLSAFPLAQGLLKRQIVNRIRMGILLGCGMIAFSSLQSSAKNFYVRAGASGSNNGSDWNNAWKECSSIVWGGSGVNAGDTVYFAGGNYSTTMIPNVSGNSSSWVTIRRVLATDSDATSAAGWNGSYDSQVIISTGSDALDFNTLGLSYIMVDGRVDSGIRLVTPNSDGASISFNHGVDHITLTNLDLAGPGGSTAINMNGDNRGIDATAWNGSVYEPVNHLIVSHCRIHGQVNNVWLMNCYNAILEHTKFYDAAAANSTTYHANVCATSGCTNVTWRYNEIYNHQVEGIMCIFGGSAYWYIYGNVWHDGMTGVSRVLEAQDGVEGPFYFYNNTIANVVMGIRTANGGSYAAGSTERNNIYWNCAIGGGISDSDYDFANSATGETHGVNNGSNPFVGSGNYHIVTTTSATMPRGKGVTLPAPYNMDFDGNLFTAPFDIGAYAAVGGAVSSDTNAPTVSLTAPTSGATVSNSVAFSANATDNTGGSGVASVSFSVDGNVVATDTASPYTYNWNSLSSANGSHTIKATATDFAGNVGSSSTITVTLANPPPDTTAPTVSIAAPTAGSVVSNSVTLTANASDSGTGVASVSFTVDGYTVGTDSNAPYTMTWVSSSVTNGNHTVQAVAKDLAGNTATSSSVSINVMNPPTSLSTGLVGYWKFDETSGTTAADSSGNGNTGTLVGDAAHAVGLFNEALSLDGGTGYARVPSTANLEQISGPITISTWVRFTSNVTYTAGDMQSIARKVINENDNSAAPYAAYDLVVQDFGGGTFKARMAVTRASDSVRGLSGWGNAHTYGTWYQFVGVYDGTNVMLYVNGVLEASAPFSGTLLQTTGQPLCIGRYGTAAEPVNGLIDEFRLYNRALVPADISTLYNTAAPPAPFGLKIVPN